METSHPAPNEPPAGDATGVVPLAPPLAEPSFVVVPLWLWRVYLHPASWAFSMIAMISCIVAAMLSIAIAVGTWAALDDLAFGAWGVREGAIAFVAIGGIVTACVFAIRAILKWSALRCARSFEPTIPLSEPARGLMLAELLESGPPKDNWSAARAQRWTNVVRSRSTARIFLTRRLEERAVRYDRTDRPVEPERVGAPTGSNNFGTALWFGGIAAYFAWSGGVRSPLLWMFGFFAVATLVRLIRRRAVFAPVIAGQGWIEHGSARWTVNDSVIVATGWSNARVRVVGPPGVLSLQLQTGRGKDFEALWMRWMHPAPNLEQRAFDA